MFSNINTVINKLTEAGIEFKENELMSAHTSFKVGGAADVFASPSSIEEFCKTVNIAKENNVPVFILGKGSNILVLDTGIRGVVVTTEKLNNYKVDGKKFYCECGVSLTYSAIVAKDNSLAGLSFAYGIPGSIGGAVYMNAGAYGGQISDVLVKTTYYNAETNEICECTDHHFGYRESIYKEN